MAAADVQRSAWQQRLSDRLHAMCAGVKVPGPRPLEVPTSSRLQVQVNLSSLSVCGRKYSYIRSCDSCKPASIQQGLRDPAVDPCLPNTLVNIGSCALRQHHRTDSTGLNR